MTPGARLSAAIEILDRVLAGEPVERALTTWGRGNRFAGSGDRAAIRDIVFDALRRRRSAAVRGGGLTGRGLVLGLCREEGREPLFSGEGHAPPPPGELDIAREPEGAEALDLPDWLAPEMKASLGEGFGPVLQALRNRAPIFLRVNLAKTDVGAAIRALASEGIGAKPHPLSPTALEVTENARRLHGSAPYREGLVELQDASSQAVVDALPLAHGFRVLDHCAGGGGKTLAMAARARLVLFAHDANPERMADLPERARRAGTAVTITANPEAEAPFDLVLVDAPCSGSGSWRRDPQGKWALTPERLETVRREQAAILQRVAPMVRPGGWIGYATCSLLQSENQEQIATFLAVSPGWTRATERVFTPLDGGDGFYLATLRRAQT
jgi:16S rRNA (cytosine967-C5)-methyltransferase